MTRAIVCGGRDYSDWVALSNALDRELCCELIGYDTLTIVHGGAPGADSLADSWASMRSVRQEIFPANWSKFGRRAGPIRNQQMIDTFPDVVIAFPGGRGTADMVSRARRAAVRVVEVT